MTIHKLAAGSGYEYLTRQVAAADSTELGSTPLADYYEARGEAPGRWLGSGLVGLSGIETGDVVTVEQMGHLFGEGKHPLTGAALGRPQRKGGVAGFDLTFSPVKSVSALWAVAPPAIARAIEEAHEAAVADALTYVEREVLFTREGTDGARQVETRGLVAAAFRHRDTRAGDPDLHTHVAVANKVQTLGGKWLSVYGSVLYAHTVAISETYNTALEARLRERLGVRFAERFGGVREKRSVREIVGVDPGLCRFWSRRRLSIVAAERDLVETFIQEHRRAPTAKEERALAQQANLATRDRKHDPVSERGQRANWHREATNVLGSPGAVDQMLRDAVAPRVAPSDAPGAGATPAWRSRRWLEETAEDVVTALEEHRATWQSWHLRAEAQRQVRTCGEVPADVLPSVVDVVEEVVRSRLINLTPEPPDHLEDSVPAPPLLHRRDGTSVYRHAGGDHYTSLRILQAEQRLVTAGALTSDFRFTAEEVEVSFRRAEIRGGVRLNAGQQEMVRSMATSGHRLRVALAPAGSGKTTAVRALARVWADHGYPAVGLAPSAAAAAVLREATGMPCETLAKLDYDVATARSGRTPRGFARSIQAGSLVVIDEAGMADTPTLARVVGHCLDQGATVRLVGDDQQLAAVGAGGVVRNLVTGYGADRLDEVVRFTDPAEAAASLDLRAGDPAALGFYFDNDRIHTSDIDTALAEVFDQWSRAHAAGVDALMLAPTRDLVADLNARARAARLAQEASRNRGRSEVPLSDGNQASAGDVVITRRNNRRLGLSGTDWVKNGDRWTITKVRRDGGLKVVNQAGLAVVLPPDYVADHVELGYASTVHTAQGLTAEAMYGIVAGTETRQLLYTMLTRGRTENHLHVIIDPDTDACGTARGAASGATAGDPVLPGILEQLSVGPVLDEIIARDGAAVSATTARLRGASTSGHLREAVTRYTDAVTLAAQRTYRGDWEDALEAAGQGPLPWLPAVPADVAAHETWGPYLNALGDLVTAQATTFRALTNDHARETKPPMWAKRHADVLDKDRGLYDEIRLWRAATGVPDDDRRLTGKPANAIGVAAFQRDLRRRYEAALSDSVQEWAEKAATYAGRGDERTLDLARFLDRLHRDGYDAAAMLHRAATARPLPAERTSGALGYRIQQQLRHAIFPPNPAHGLRPSEPEISPSSGLRDRDPYRNSPGLGM